MKTKVKFGKVFFATACVLSLGMFVSCGSAEAETETTDNEPEVEVENEDVEIESEEADTLTLTDEVIESIEEVETEEITE